MNFSPHERVGSEFDIDGLKQARAKTWQAVDLIATELKAGVTEDEGREIAQSIITELGGGKNWHAPQIRFGINTVKSFGEPSVPDLVLKKQDIFFIDIGPVFEGYEGDAGNTFQVGESPDHTRIIRDVKSVYDLVAERWRNSGDSGLALYAFASQEASRLGWNLVLKGASGHRIGDFPHAIYSKKKLNNLDIAPSPDRWILEIQLEHPTKAFGAFYEDMLSSS